MRQTTTTRSLEPSVVLSGGRLPGAPDGVVRRGRRGRPHEEVRRRQRARIIDAFVGEVGKHGLNGAHVSQICAAAGVSARGFYANFESKEQCFCESFDIGAELVCQAGIAAYHEIDAPWEHRLRCALHAMLSILADNRAFCRLCIVEVHYAGEMGRRRLDAVIERCRKELGGGPGVPFHGVPAATYECALVGGALHPLIDYVVEDKIDRLMDLELVLTYSLALPVVGQERAVLELERPLG